MGWRGLIYGGGWPRARGGESEIRGVQALISFPHRSRILPLSRRSPAAPDVVPRGTTPSWNLSGRCERMLRCWGRTAMMQLARGGKINPPRDAEARSAHAISALKLSWRTHQALRFIKQKRWKRWDSSSSAVHRTSKIETQTRRRCFTVCHHLHTIFTDDNGSRDTTTTILDDCC